MISAEQAQAERIRLLMHLRRQGITDTRTLGAMEAVPREMFVSSHFRDKAYEDHALPIEKDQTISQPTIVATMTMMLDVNDRHTVLEIGTGSGYQAAVLAKLARRVHSIERHRELFEVAQARFEALGLRNITTHFGDGAKGWPHAAPYDRIIVTAASPVIQPAWNEQLADGGIMVLPLGETVADQHLVKVLKEGDKLHLEHLMPVRFVPLVEGELA